LILQPNLLYYGDNLDVLWDLHDQVTGFVR
jgi:hypothetical protein